MSKCVPMWRAKLMSKTCAVTLAACAVVGLAFAWLSREPAAAQDKPAHAGVKWEYKIVHKPVAQLTEKEGQAEFNKLGEDGWELCATISTTSSRGPWGVFVFKRPKR